MECYSPCNIIERASSNSGKNGSEEKRRISTGNREGKRRNVQLRICIPGIPRISRPNEARPAGWETPPARRHFSGLFSWQSDPSWEHPGCEEQRGAERCGAARVRQGAAAARAGGVTAGAREGAEEQGLSPRAGCNCSGGTPARGVPLLPVYPCSQLQDVSRGTSERLIGELSASNGKQLRVLPSLSILKRKHEKGLR